MENCFHYDTLTVLIPGCVWNTILNSDVKEDKFIKRCGWLFYGPEIPELDPCYEDIN